MPTKWEGFYKVSTGTIPWRWQHILHQQGYFHRVRNPMVLPGIAQSTLHTQCHSLKNWELKEPCTTGYVVPDTNRRWAGCMKKFSLQTGCEYTEHSHKRSNAQSWEIEVIHSRIHMHTGLRFLLGGTREFKSLDFSTSNHSLIGTRQFVCKAIIHIWLLNVK